LKYHTTFAKGNIFIHRLSFGEIKRWNKIKEDIIMTEKFCGFLWGVLFGTAGITLLSSKDAKKAYTHVTAAVLRGKDDVVKKATILRENCEDIYADANDINEKRAEAEEAKIIADARRIVEEADSRKAAAET